MAHGELHAPEQPTSHTTRTSTGPPACLMLLIGLAPVPPSWPLIWMMSALAFATPLATTPMPASATSLTETWFWV